MIARMPYAGKGKPVIQSLTTSGNLVIVIKELNMNAPASIIIMVAVILAESINVLQNTLPVICLFTRPMTRAPKAPIPAASVGVNQPKYIPPITRKNRTRIAQVNLSEVTFSLKVVEVVPGARFGLSPGPYHYSDDIGNDYQDAG